MEENYFEVWPGVGTLTLRLIQANTLPTRLQRLPSIASKYIKRQNVKHLKKKSSKSSKTE